MTAQQTTIPTGRLDALVIGSADMAVRLELALKAVVNSAAVQRFDDYMLAMAHLAAKSSQESENESIASPVDIVVGDIKLMEDAAGPTARALRELAPGAKLLLVADGELEQAARQAVADGFDEYFLGQPSVKQLAVAAGVAHRGLTVSAKGGGDMQQAGQIDGAEQLQHVLGDVDLVENILTGQKGLPQLAMRLIGQQSGIAGVGFVVSGQEIPTGHVAVEVKMAGQQYGFLHAPSPATQADLAAWSSWLGRWLALDTRVASLQQMAMHDELTGVYNRRYFNRFLDKILKRAGNERFNVTLMVFDIDDFKVYNDRYGHSAGDEILREAAKLMKSMVREHDVVARIGGDEFAVIFWENGESRDPNSEHPKTVHTLAKRFQKAICEKAFPKLAEEAAGTLTVSAGLAGFPWDGRIPEELLELADQMAIKSKRSGKNAITLGPGVLKQCGG